MPSLFRTIFFGALPLWLSQTHTYMYKFTYANLQILSFNTLSQRCSENESNLYAQKNKIQIFFFTYVSFCSKKCDAMRVCVLLVYVFVYSVSSLASSRIIAANCSFFISFKLVCGRFSGFRAWESVCKYVYTYVYIYYI